MSEKDAEAIRSADTQDGEFAATVERRRRFPQIQGFPDFAPFPGCRFVCVVRKPALRRSEVVGIFPNEEAVTRLIGALLLEQNDVYGPPPPCKVFRLTTTDPVLAVVYPALSRGNTPQALMVFADRRPDKWTISSGSHRSLTFAEPGQTRFAIIVRYPRKPAPLGSSADPVTPPPEPRLDGDMLRHG